MEKSDCGCKNQSNNVPSPEAQSSAKTNSKTNIPPLIPIENLAIYKYKILYDHPFSKSLLHFLLPLNMSCAASFSKDNISAINFKGALSENDMDALPITVGFKYHDPAFNFKEININYTKNGKVVAVPKQICKIISTIIKQKYTKAIKNIIANSNNNNETVTTPLSELLGTSVSKIVDNVTSALETSITLNYVKTYSTIGFTVPIADEGEGAWTAGSSTCIQCLTWFQEVCGCCDDPNDSHCSPWECGDC